MNKNHADTAIQRHRDSSQGILYISSGLPGAGKSTFLKNNKREEEVIVSRDEIRFSLLKKGEEYFSREEEVFDLFIKNIVLNLKAGKNVYADATHLTPQSQIKLLAPVLLESEPPQVNFIYFNVPLTVCLQRNENRKGTKTFVPPAVIRKMASYANFRPCSYIDHMWIVDTEGNISKER